MCLRASELISCEWCSLRKLPVLFFQTSEEECVRLRTQLNMSREESGQWYDCSGDRESAPANQQLPVLHLFIPFSSFPFSLNLSCYFSTPLPVDSFFSSSKSSPPSLPFPPLLLLLLCTAPASFSSCCRSVLSTYA